MPVLTDAQIAGYAAGAGFTGDQVTVMTAIALAESSGNSDAKHVNSNGTTDWGLWQLNDANHIPGNLLDPAVNAAGAKTIYGRQGYGAWTTYNRGTYLAYMGRAHTAAQAPATSAGSSSTVAPSPDATGLTGAVGTVTAGSTWARIGLFILGSVLLFFAVLRLTGGDRIVIRAAKTAAKVGVAA